MAGVHLLDRIIGDEYPSFATDADVRAFEQTPYSDRIAAASTYEALKLGAAHNPDAPAIQFLANAEPTDTPAVISYRDFIARVTQAAISAIAISRSCTIWSTCLRRDSRCPVIR